jgi:hypothetical protein
MAEVNFLVKKGLTVPKGSASTPSVIFDASDPNTGLYSPGADQVAVATNGQGRLFVDASGNVGIANSSPTNARLLVGDDLGAITTAARMVQVGHPSGGMLILGKDNTDYSYLTHEASTQTSNWFYRGGAGITLTSAGLVGIGTSSPVSKINSVISQADNANVSDTTLANSFLHLGGGEYGLNRYFLTTYGYSTGRTNSGAFIGAIGASASGFGKYDLVFGTRDVTTDTAPDTRMIIKTDGKVGIGTTSPSDTSGFGRTLDINGTTGAACYVRTNGSATDYGLIGHYGADFYVNNNSNGPTRFFTNGSERLRIDSDGRLLVNTTTARSSGALGTGLHQVESATYAISQLFSNGTGADGSYIGLWKSRGGTVGSTTIVQSGDIVGGIYFGGADGTNLVTNAAITSVIDGTPGASDMPGRLVFSTTPTGASTPLEALRIRSDQTACFIGDTGTAGVGVRSVIQATTLRGIVSGEYVFQGGHSGSAGSVGTVTSQIGTDGNVQNTNNSYGAISDAKLKENIVDASLQWDDLKAIQVRNYNFKKETGYSTHTQIGLIAQEVELVSPGLVSESPDRDEDGNDLGAHRATGNRNG